MRRLYVSDLDHTLLNPDAQLSDFANRGLRRILEAGADFTIATARSIASMQHILGDLPLRLPVVGTHGALVTDYHTSEHVHVAALASDVAADVLRRAAERGLRAFLSTVTDEGDRLYYDRCSNQGMEWYRKDREHFEDPRLRRVDDVVDHVDEQVVCVTVMEREEVIREFAAAIGDVHGACTTIHVFPNGYSPPWWWTTIHCGRATKGNGLATLIAREGLDDHEIVAFGDSDGDLTLFAAAHHGIAVANSSPSLQEAATSLIGHHAEDAVVDYILRDLGLDG